jgi:hypothetical protein
VFVDICHQGGKRSRGITPDDGSRCVSVSVRGRMRTAAHSGFVMHFLQRLLSTVHCAFCCLGWHVVCFVQAFQRKRGARGQLKRQRCPATKSARISAKIAHSLPHLADVFTSFQVCVDIIGHNVITLTRERETIELRILEVSSTSSNSRDPYIRQ